MRRILLALVLGLLCGDAFAADPTGWMVTVNSATGKWAAASGMTFNVPAPIGPMGNRASNHTINTGIGATIAFPGGIGVTAGWTKGPQVDSGVTSAHLSYGFATECGGGVLNGGNRMVGGTVTCTNNTGSVSLTVTPY